MKSKLIQAQATFFKQKLMPLLIVVSFVAIHCDCIVCK